MSIREEKDRLRNGMKKALSALTETEKTSQSSAIGIHLLTLLPADSSPVCAFMPMEDEPDIQPVLEEMLRRNIPLFLPRYDDHQITFRRITSLAELQAGPWEILEPPAAAPEPDPQDIDLAIVPGRAFDGNLNRLGRGKAGYDAWIGTQHSRNISTQFVGVAFREQIVDAVPMEEHDQHMDMIVTPDGILLPKGEEGE